MTLRAQAIIDDARKFQHFGEHETAIEWLNEAFELEDLTRHEAIEVEKLLCFSYRKLKEYDLALIHINKAISLLEKSQGDDSATPKRELGICYMNKGVVYQERGDYSNSRIYCTQALDLFETLRKTQDVPDGVMINAYITVASLCYFQKDYNATKDYLYKTIPFFEAMGDSKSDDGRYQSVLNTLREIERA